MKRVNHMRNSSTTAAVVCTVQSVGDMCIACSCWTCDVAIILCRDDENGNATENGVAALGKALQHMQNLPDSSAVAELWVQSLPLTVDADEAKIAHKQLVGLIQKSDQR